MTKVQVYEPSALARPSREIEPWRTPDWQRLWLASQGNTRPWRTLALLPAAPGASPETMVQIALSLAHTGMTHLGTPIHVADATRITLAQLTQFSEEMEHYGRQNGLVLVALSALSESVTSLSLAQAADWVLLCVLLRKMSMDESKKTVERIGKSRFIGSAVFRATPK
jgi:hypothetical protein